MTITLIGSGGIFTILGAIACATRNINGARHTSNPSPSSQWGASGPQIRNITTSISNIIAAHSVAQEKYYDGIRSIEAGYVSAQTTALSGLKALAQSELIAIVNADTPLPSLTVTEAMKTLIKQMKASSDTVLRCAVARTVTAGSGNVGNATVICSPTGRYGVPQEYALAETLVATCIGDADGNGSTATAGNEPIQIIAPAANSDKFSQLWPQGSAANVQINVIDPDTDAGTNLLTNSNFETWALSTVPDNWTILVGTGGTSVKKATTNTYGVDSTNALQFVGDASELTSVVQSFAASAGAGTTATLKPATVYGFNIWVYVDVVPAAGVFKVDLVDGSNAVINDDAGTANTLTQAITALTGATYTNISGFFRTPSNIPATMKLRLRLSTALSVGSKLNIDFAAMGESTQLYTAGPYVNAFRASTDLSYNDTWTIAITNDRAGIFQTWFEQAFDMSAMGLILPSAAAGNTVNENLVA